MKDDTLLSLLSLLAVEKEFGQYKMPKAIKTSYRTLLRYIKLLETDGYIRLVRTEPSKKGGKDRKVYSLTFKGLMYAMLNTTDPEKLVTIINNKADMLLAFKKYPLFENAGLKDYFLHSLNSTINSYFIHEVTWQLKGFELQFNKQEDWQDIIGRLLLTSPFLLTRGQPDQWETWRKKFIEVVKKDPELRKFVSASLKKQEDRLAQVREARATLEE
jgi:DNA-binding PadR family transcriptional regulator